MIFVKNIIVLTLFNQKPFYLPVESPIINTQCGAISLASLQPPLLTAPPLQPRPATIGSLDLMLPLQPKLLPGYNLQSSYLSNTLSTVRPPDLDKELKPCIEVIVEKTESSCENSESGNQKSSSQKSEVDSEGVNLKSISQRSEIGSEVGNQKSSSQSEEVDSDSANHNNVFNIYEINSNVIDNKESTVTDLNSDDSPNNNSC